VANSGPLTLTHTSLCATLFRSTTAGAITQSGSFSTGGSSQLTAGSGGVTLNGFSGAALEVIATGGTAQLDNGTVTGAFKASGTTISMAGADLPGDGTLTDGSPT